MATVNELRSVYDELIALGTTLESRSEEINSQLTSIKLDPSSPDAQSKLDDLIAKYQLTVRTPGRDTFIPLQNSFRSLYDTSDSNTQKQVVAEVTSFSNLVRSVQTYLNNYVKLRDETQAAINNVKVSTNNTNNSNTGTDNEASPGTGSNQNSDQDDRGNQTTGSGSTPNTNSGQSGSNAAGTTQSAKTTTGDKNLLPGKRLKNPLANFSSYTYTLTLYLLTPDAYDAFNASRRQNINALNDAATGSLGGAGAYILMQSGGINSDPNQKPGTGSGGANRRAPGFGYDYYIDDLRIKTAANAKATQTMTNITELSFNIYEPYGFSFLTNLTAAVKSIQAYSKSKNYTQNINALKQIFVLGIRFQGYDAVGNVLTGKESFAADTRDVSGNSGGVFERFYDIMIKKINFKIDGKTTVYKVDAISLPTQVSMSLKKGMVSTNTTISAETVLDALSENNPNSLLSKLNNEQLDLLKANKIEFATTYKLRFDGQTEDIQSAQLKSKADLDKSRTAFSNAKSIKDVNPKLEAKTIPNLNTIQLTFKDSTPIMQAISSVITQSSYLENAIQKVNFSAVQTPPNKDGEPNNDEVEINWYNLSADVSNARWDNKQKDYVFDITYVIQKYSTPVVQAAGIKKLPKYYGPHKRYEYWFTGYNSEIISYEQVLDTAYFNVATDPGAGIAEGDAVDISYSPNFRQNVNRLGRNNEGLETQNAYINWLIDPGRYAKAKIYILGDPDFLMNEYPGRFSDDYLQFYGIDGYTIKPNGGQVFVEINFLEAVDYGNSKGTLQINDKIILWKYPKEVQDSIDSRGGGISYMVISVVSNFAKGKFTQELDLSINTFSDIGSNTAQADAGRSTQAETRATNNAVETNVADNQINGLTIEPSTTSVTAQAESQVQGQVDRETNTGQTNGGQVATQTNSGVVQNDDAVGTTFAGLVDYEGGRG